MSNSTGAPTFIVRASLSPNGSLLIREQLPRGLNPQMGPVTSIMGEIMLVALTSDGRASAMEVREIADFVLRPQLLALSGVAQVIPIGGEVRQYRVTPNVATMQALDVTHEQIEQAITRFGTNTGGGFVDQSGREFLIRNVGLTKRLEDLANTVVIHRNNQAILLKQVATVEFAARVKRGDAGYQGEPAVIIGIQKQPNADTVSLTRKVEAALNEIQKTLPPGVTATNIQFRQATFIETSIGNVQRVLVEAAIVVAIVLFVFLMNVRATAISLAAIPISILITVLVFRAFDLTINTMTLGGLAIAIGELVDDAVVGVENILRRLRQNSALPNPRPVIEVVAKASQEVRSGIIYATMIIVLVFVPLFALSGIEGRLFAPLGIAYIVSIFASLVTSITVTPVLAYYLLSGSGHAHAGDGFVVRHLKRGNAALLQWAFAHRSAVFASVARRGRRGGHCRLPDAAQLPAAVQRRHAAGHHPVQSRASRWRNRIGSGSSPRRSLRRCRKCARSAAAPDAPSSTSMPKACTTAKSTSTSPAPPAARKKSTPISAHGCPCCRWRSTSGSRSRIASTTCCRACGRKSR